jgi:hypothetical protein
MSFFKSLWEGFKTLPPWAKGVVGVTVVGGTTVATVMTYKGIKRAIDKAKSAASIKDVAAERAKLQEQGQNQTFQDSQYKGWASAIQNQFSGCDFSTPMPIFPGKDLSYSGTKLYETLSGFKNNVDFLKLVEAWGIRTYDDCGWGTGDVTNVNLYQAVTDELGNGEVATINELLQSKGITYKF